MPTMSGILSGAALAVSLIPAGAFAQGYTPYDTYRDAYGGPHYTNNLTPQADDRTVLGPVAAEGDPFLVRTRPARGWGEVDEIGAGFWEWQGDRIRQRRQSAEEQDAFWAQRDTAWAADRHRYQRALPPPSSCCAWVPTPPRRAWKGE